MQTLQWAVLGQDQGRLHHAIERGGPDNIKLDSCSPFSPLSLAAGIGNYDITKLLLDEGAPINCLNAEAGTALYAASLAGHKEVVDLLLKRGADPSLCSLSGSSPLMVAASEGYLEILQALLKNGSKVDDKDESGGTALFHAAAGGQAGAVHELLEGRADHHVANTQGLTPLHAAMVAKAVVCVAMLQEAERMYLLHKTRTVSEDRLKRGQLRTWPLPPYYLRIDSALPLVELRRPEGKEETAAVVLEWVVKGMDADVFAELAEMLGRDGRAEGGEEVKLVAQGQEQVAKVGTRKRAAVDLNE